MSQEHVRKSVREKLEGMRWEFEIGEDGQKLLIDGCRIDFFLMWFDLKIGDGKHGLIVDMETGEPIEGTDGEPVPITNMADVVYIDEKPRPLRDHFSSITQYERENYDFEISYKPYLEDN